MYIYKMVFAEREDFTEEEYDFLLDKNVIWETDYGTTEIAYDRVQEVKEEKDIMDVLNKRLGTDVVELLLKGDLDMVSVTY